VTDRILEVEGLGVAVGPSDAATRLLTDVSFAVYRGQVLGVVGESGAGKSVLTRAILRLLDPEQVIDAGAIRFRDHDLADVKPGDLRRLRGRELAAILPDAKAQLNPVVRIGALMASALRAHGVARGEVRERSAELLRTVGIADPERRLDAYPHELSGGMAQRVCVALALMHDPALIVADEPTAGLDVTVQRQVLDLMATLARERGAAQVIVTRDLGIVAHYCQTVVVLRHGHVVESGPVEQVFANPSDPYTAALIEASRGATARTFSGDDGRAGPLLQVDRLTKRFVLDRQSSVLAASEVSFEIGRGETVGLVGESGSGKTTVGRCVLRLLEPSEGRVEMDGVDVTALSDRELRRLRPRMQLVFQEPYASLNPRMSVGQTVEEPLLLAGTLDRAAREARVRETIAAVGLDPSAIQAYAADLTGSEQQRVGIARAIVTRPDLIVLDEPTSTLDPSIRADILDLLLQLQETTGVAYLFISHDLTAVARVSHRIAIMYLGRIVEIGPAERIFQRQAHPYSRALLSAVLEPDPVRRLEPFQLKGEIPSAIERIEGCPLHRRCPLRIERCTREAPPLEPIEDGTRATACFRWQDVAAEAEPAARTTT
jgi:oligopeptide/dipeptide ABC transporter ATP-binding protein